MTETPSGNRWEPAEDSTQPLASTPSPAAEPVAPPPATEPDAASPTVEPVAAQEYGWAPAPSPAQAAAPRRARRRTGLLAGGAAALVIGSAAGGYAIGSATAGPDGQDFGTTRQAPQHGFAPGPGFPGQNGPGDDHGDDDDQFGGPGDGTDGGAG